VAKLAVLCRSCREPFLIFPSRIGKRFHCSATCQAKAPHQRASERFWKCVDKVSSPAGCWLWTAQCFSTGYGRFDIGNTNRTVHLAHRWAYSQIVTTLSPEIHLHHKCEQKRCVNPEHLEEVSPTRHHAIHAAKRTHCPSGHPFDATNTRQASNGRVCRECHKLHERTRRRRVTAHDGLKAPWLH
jgi:hypothetical protein